MEEFKAQRILIVSHTFPPAAGVGGRRWAKFAKYFSRQGHHVEVLRAQNHGKSESPWADDVSGIPQHTYTNTFPQILNQRPVNLFEKINYRLALAKMKWQSRGTPYDRALCDESSYRKALETILNSKNIDWVVVTGAPFGLLTYTAKVIPKYRNVFFIADFRDPWTWGPGYGYRFLPDRKMNFEKEAEAKVIAAFDKITSPAPEIVKHLSTQYPDHSHKIMVLPHGYDPEDIPQDVVHREEKSRTKLIYGGSLYPDTLPDLKAMAEAVSRSYQHFQLDVYSRDRPPALDGLKGVHFYKPLKAPAFFERAREADRIVILIPDVVKDSVLSKLYEVAALGVPVLALGRRGSLSKFIESKALGIFKNHDESMETFIGRDAGVNSDREWLQAYSMEAICDKFVRRINKDTA